MTGHISVVCNLMITNGIYLLQAMPSGSQAYDDQNLYKKLTVKELNGYTGTEGVSYEDRRQPINKIDSIFVL